jgi:hypothetical protein
MKHREPNGVRRFDQTAARRSLADVGADLREFLDGLREEMGSEAQHAV